MVQLHGVPPTSSNPAKLPPGPAPLPRLRTRFVSTPGRVPPANDRPRLGDDVLQELWPMIQDAARAACRSPTEAEDVAQAAVIELLQAMEKSRKLQPNMQMVGDIIRRIRARERRRMTAFGQLVADAASDPDDVLDGVATADDHIMLEDVADLIAHLPADRRQVIELVAIEGLSYKEAADAIGAPIGTVMSRLARARAALAKSAAC